MSGPPRASYRPDAPAPDAIVRWPEGFGQRFTIFVDTEEEFDWNAPFDRAHRSVSAAAAIPDAARRFADLGACLTFLADHPIVTDPAAIAPLARAVADHGGAVGAQLHPWVNPPFADGEARAAGFAGTLPADVEAAKIASLTAAITAAFGTAPAIYRAGRYGLGPATFAVLRRNGYRVDSSMRARYDYRAIGGPDYRGVGNDAFRIDGGGLTELPLTTVFTGMLRSVGPGLFPAAGRVPRGIGVLARTGLLNRVALTPEEMPLDDALEAIRVAAGEGLALLNFSFHSPSLVPGHTPYVRDVAQLAAFWRWWDAVLALLATLGVRSAGQADLLDALDAAPGAPR